MIILKTEEQVVEQILNQELVGLIQGHSEWGPRALGNRSLLFDPRNKDSMKIVNEIKGREWWRPLAATVMLEHAHDWFEMDRLKDSPYMSFAIPVKNICKEKAPGIVHVDNTCRIQTLTKDQNPLFYNIINTFYEKTKVPMLLNTSFNIAGMPLVEEYCHIEEDFIANNIKLRYILKP